MTETVSAAAIAQRGATDIPEQGAVGCRPRLIIPAPVTAAEPRMSDYEFTMSLRIRHPHAEPAEITRVLGIEPQHTWRAGDPRRDSAGGELLGTHRETYWMGRLMVEPELASDHVGVESVILRTLAQLRKAGGFLATLKDEGGAAELQVSIFAREEFCLELLPESLALLGRLGLGMVVEIKPHSHGVAPIEPH
ncbi:MAG: DUF4279 domain-containing protein [Steroidobacteraceae bacterium]